jgi:DNA-binding NtrC family response regulator
MVTHTPVLIVDGNPQMTAMLQRYLARQLVDLADASSLADVRQCWRSRTLGWSYRCFYALRDGLDLLRYIRQTVPGMRGILMTAFSAPALCRQAPEGAYAVLLSLSDYRSSGTLCSPPYRASSARGE